MAQLWFRRADFRVEAVINRGERLPSASNSQEARTTAEEPVREYMLCRPLRGENSSSQPLSRNNELSFCKPAIAAYLYLCFSKNLVSRL